MTEIDHKNALIIQLREQSLEMRQERDEARYVARKWRDILKSAETIKWISGKGPGNILDFDLPWEK